MLAAGAATRFGAPKQRLFLPDVLAALRASSVEDVVVVAGAHELETDARVVQCPDWERGPGASLRCGLRELDAEAAVVVLADGPRSIRARSTASSTAGATARANGSRPRTTA